MEFNFSLTPMLIPTLDIDGTPEIYATASTLWVAWREGATGELWAATMSQSGQWTGPGQLIDSAHNVWTSGVPPTFGQYRGNGTLYLLRTDSNDQLDFLYGGNGNSTFYASGSFNVPAGLDYQTEGKPGLAWVRYVVGNNDGYWSIVYPNVAWGPHVAWKYLVNLRFGIGTVPNRLTKFGSWWYAPPAPMSLELLYAAEDDNIHAATFRANGLEISPYADGFADIDILGGINDFELMSNGICESFSLLDDRPCGPLGAFRTVSIPIEFHEGEW